MITDIDAVQNKNNGICIEIPSLADAVSIMSALRRLSEYGSSHNDVFWTSYGNTAENPSYGP